MSRPPKDFLAEIFLVGACLLAVSMMGICAQAARAHLPHEAPSVTPHAASVEWCARESSSREEYVSCLAEMQLELTRTLLSDALECPPWPPACACDLDGDGVCGGPDFSIYRAAQFATNDGQCP